MSTAEVAELESAAHAFLARHEDISHLRPETFVVKTLQPKLEALRTTLIHGIGFEVIGGLPVDRLGDELASTIFFGIGAHLGSARSQNADGHLLGHVRDIGADSRDPNTRIYQTRERQTFHTDSADVVGLLCLNEARQGGDSLLVSAVTIYNAIRRDRPDLLAYLFDNIATDRRGEVPAGAKPFFTIPVFSWHEGFLTVMYQRQYIDSAQRFADAPRLTVDHVEALDLFDALANDPRLECQHAARAWRHAIRLQPQPAPRSHKFRRLAGARPPQAHVATLALSTGRSAPARVFRATLWKHNYRRSRWRCDSVIRHAKVAAFQRCRVEE